MKRHRQHPQLETFAVAEDGAQLQWYRKVPADTGGPWPGLAFFHPGGYHGGGPTSPDLVAVMDDCVLNGYACFSCTYRLDGTKLPGQTSNGEWPQQTDDVKAAVLAILAHPTCNGKVGTVGGSAGGTHAFSIATESVGGPSGWSADKRVICAVCLSGGYKFEERSPDPNLNSFVSAVNRYTGTTDLDKQAEMSPIARIDEGPGQFFLVSSQQDPMPPIQMTRGRDALVAIGETPLTALVAGSAHAFANWNAVRTAAIAFLDSHLK